VEFESKTYEGIEAGPIISEVLEAANTVSKNLVRVLDNIKGKTSIGRATANPEWDGYVEKIRESDLDEYTDTMEYSERDVAPAKIMVMEVFTTDKLRTSRFNKDMGAGAANTDSKSYNDLVLETYQPRLGLGFENTFWNGITVADKTAIAASGANAKMKALVAATPTTAKKKVSGIITRFVQDFDKVQFVDGTAITLSNMDGEYDKVLLSLHGVASGLWNGGGVNGKPVIYAPHSHKLLINMANKNKVYRDIFTIENGNYFYLSTPIEFVPVPENVLMAGRGYEDGDFLLATDVTSDALEVKIDKVNTTGDEKFLKAVASLDSQVLVPQQKVIRIA
jgi:hypothetical protein